MTPIQPTDAYVILGTLDALLALARMDHPASAGLVADRLGVSATRVAEALLHLEGRGLADASAVRLTLAGLAAASALAADGARRVPVAA